MTNDKLAPVDKFKMVLNSDDIKARLKNSLKNNWTQFATSMLDLYSGDSYLQKCDPQAVALECVKAATLNLPISKTLGFAYVVPYKNVPTFTIGYKGLGCVDTKLIRGFLRYFCSVLGKDPQLGCRPARIFNDERYKNIQKDVC